jgi:hypothetical protein
VKVSDDFLARLDLLDEGAGDPVAWVQERLGETLWSRQRDIARAVRDHQRVAVMSANSTGKSHGAARIAAWWIDQHPVGEAFVLTTAPTQRQTEVILWGAIRRAHDAGKLRGEIGRSPQWRIGDELVAIGWKSADAANADEAAAAFQGIHARYLLVVIDEAAGVAPWLWEAVESMAISGSSRVLALGNPTDPGSHFAKVCAPGSGWHTLSVSAFDCPAFTGEDVPAEIAEQLANPGSVERMRRTWGEDSARYVARVLGEFPDDAEDALIARAWIREAQARDLSAGEGSVPGVLGVDVARSGGDETVAYVNRGGVARRVHAARGHDLMRTAGVVRRLQRDECPGALAVVDATGLGFGVVDSLNEQGARVRAFVGAEQARRPDRFVNRRAEVFWDLREALRGGLLDIDPADEELAAQLGELRFFEDSRGRVQIESKQNMARRGVSSPDRADALALTVAVGGWQPVDEADRATSELARIRAAQEAAYWANLSTERWLAHVEPPADDLGVGAW